MFGVFTLAFGMMVGTVPTSVPQFILLGNWILELDFKRKWRDVKQNKIFWLLASVFLIHVIGLLYTNDLASGWNDVRTKIPLMFLPLVFLTTQPLSKKEFHGALFCFLLGCSVNLAWCYTYSFILHKNEVVRSASRFMSHIRLGLYLNVAISCCVYFIFIYREMARRIVFTLLIFFFLFGMYFLGLASGLTNFLLLVFIACCYIITRQNLLFKIISATVLFAGTFGVIRYVQGVYESLATVKNTSYNRQQQKSLSGRNYCQVDTVSKQKENGNYVFINIQFDELKNEWNRRCPEDSFSYAPKTNLSRYEILLRYLTSLAYTKDSVGVSKLTTQDLANVKNNITNYESTQWSYLHKRVYEIVYEYDEFKNHRNINGHSLTMRPYFWRAAFKCIAAHPLFGVGTGDVQAEMNSAYVQTHSPLTAQWYKRPHNQFITIMVALGVAGLIIFLASLILPIAQLQKTLPALYYPFIILAVSSFILEDTLESQAGVTFYAFFNSLFLSLAYFRQAEIILPLKKPHNPAD